MKCTATRQQIARTYYLRNRERIKRQSKEWNLISTLKREAIYRDDNRAKISQRGKSWMARNAHKIRSYTNNRHAFLKLAKPRWASAEEIKRIYDKAAELTARTGLRYTVDHIIPLINKIVCGLHCEDNLQIMLLTENVRKNNKLSEGEN